MGKWLLVAFSGLLAWRGWVAFSQSAPGVGHAVLAEELSLVGPAVLALVALTLLAERRWPAVRRPLRAVGHRHDALYLGLYVLAAVPAVVLLGTGFAVTLFRFAPWLAIKPIPGLPRWGFIVLAVVVMDACNWAAHALNHRVGTFWRFHAVHHSQEELSVLTAFRSHPLVHASFELAALPIIVLGTGGAIPPAVLIGYVLFSTFPHANVNWDFGPLRSIIVSPAYHRLHHDRDDTRGVNLGVVLVLWDRLAGLAVFPERGAAPVATGLAGRPVPVEQAAPATRWLGLSMLGKQLVEPWQGSPARAAAPTAQTGRPVLVNG
ncbi:MAG TPA: sterol desaturase family protein [Acidimicrobiales bacterium]|jgi:sterol desaturase/sphingolipid hydroxylase (fatty acid hydroxylase superfamily)